MRKFISSGSHLEAPIGFSRATRIGDHIAVSGTAPIDNGETVFVGDVYEQTKYCLTLSLRAIEECSGLIDPDTLIRDNNVKHRGIHDKAKTTIQIIP
ncbi:hypothetical protein [Pseudoalteromonas viridis]|uniref:Uncharacterized protein n=1 Tax=Pseudoalteromonas viridis TaxID=339617 RepID=A0ABX7V0B6_9GAMM|nr:hypothetical protein [Pseudoalteromonas viridis]QTL34326.1 hypothetical protein J5X90_12230 [Pseudoalteromonas viridis]